jgi:hypothetical protein|tara:strand:- start:8317 stop:8622 length:306 start_codon:yes stop_codon:yes gene_type:complete
MEAKKLKDVMPERKELYPDVERIESSQLMGKEFTLKEVNELSGKHGAFYVALVELNGKTHSTAFGSKVVNDRIKQVADKLPVIAKMVEKKSKEGRVYYDLE